MTGSPFHLRAHGYDPRTISLGASEARYRVHFWERSGEPPSNPPVAEQSYACDEYMIVDPIDVVEVLAWAEANAAGRTYEVFCDVVDFEGRMQASVRLTGTDPTVPGDQRAGVASAETADRSRG